MGLEHQMQRAASIAQFLRESILGRRLRRLLKACEEHAKDCVLSQNALPDRFIANHRYLLLTHDAHAAPPAASELMQASEKGPHARWPGRQAMRSLPETRYRAAR